MRAVVFHGIGDIRLDDVPEPSLQGDQDAIVRITASAICGTDLHFVRGSLPGMRPGTILGHEGVGVVEELGRGVRNFRVGDRVVIPSTIGCGACSYCRAGYFSQCDNSNPHGPSAGTAFYGGPESSGPFDGLQAEFARVPRASVNLVKLPDEVSDEQAILLSDIAPTGWFGAELAEVRPGDTVAVFGCGPVGLFAALSAQLHDAGRVLAVDGVGSRLEAARALGVEAIDYEREDPVEALRALTDGIGVDRVVDAVGVDANRPQRGPAAHDGHDAEFEREVAELVPESRPDGDNWRPGDAPSQVLRWATGCIAKAGTLAVVGVYPEEDRTFPVGQALNKNLTVKLGICNHRRYVPMLVRRVRSGEFDPTEVLGRTEALSSAIDAYKAFDSHRSGWLKVQLDVER